MELNPYQFEFNVKQEDLTNPWKIGSLYEFQYYNCPKCVYKDHSKQEFVNHAVDAHPESKAHFNEITDDSVSDVTIGELVQVSGLVQLMQPPAFEETNESDSEVRNVSEKKEIAKKKDVSQKRKIERPPSPDLGKRFCGVQCTNCLNFIHPGIFEKHQKVCEKEVENVDTETSIDIKEKV